MFYDVVISGAGFSGKILALALRQLGIKTMIFDHAAPKYDYRISAINIATKEYLDTLGVWQHLENEAAPITEIYAIDGYSPFCVHFDKTTLGDQHRALGYTVSNRSLQVALDAMDLEVEIGCSYEYFRNRYNEVELQFKDGRNVRAGLFCGCEGRNSNLLEDLEINATYKAYKQFVLVTALDVQREHQNIAYERFVKDGPLALLPMHHPQRYGLIWTVPYVKHKHLLTLTQPELTQVLSEVLGIQVNDILYPLAAFPL